MIHVLGVSQADFAAWVCFLVGIVVLLGGAAIGLWTLITQAPERAKAKLEEASRRIEEARSQIARTSSALSQSSLESMVTADATTAADAAQESAQGAKTAVEQVEGIVASLPENLRFAGMLVLVGTVLMGVATIQFGGVSLF